MIWEPLNCGSYFEKVFLRLHLNVLEISLKIVYEKIYAFKSRGTSYLNVDLKKIFYYQKGLVS